MIISWHNDTQGEIFCRTQAQVWGDGWAGEQNDLLTQNEKKTVPGINCPCISKTYKPVNVNRFFLEKEKKRVCSAPDGSQSAYFKKERLVGN